MKTSVQPGNAAHLIAASFPFFLQDQTLDPTGTQFQVPTSDTVSVGGSKVRLSRAQVNNQSIWV